MESKSRTNGDVLDGFYDDDVFDGRDIVSTAAAATINVNDGTAIINGNNNNNNNNTSVFDEGRAEGEKEGLLTGYKDGRIIGQRNGIDYGMEIGFALGLIEAVRKKILCTSSSSSSFVDSVLLSVTKLEKAISEFPVDEDEIRRRLFRSGSSTDRKQSSREEYEDDDKEEEAYNNDSNNSEKEIESKEEDVREILQRIRARCKVLTAKLGIPHHSLKNVMKPRLNESISNKNEGNDNSNGSLSQEW